MQEQETGAWRGVIEDGELVEPHDDAYDHQRDYSELSEIKSDASAHAVTKSTSSSRQRRTAAIAAVASDPRARPSGRAVPALRGGVATGPHGPDRPAGAVGEAGASRPGPERPTNGPICRSRHTVLRGHRRTSRGRARTPISGRQCIDARGARQVRIVRFWPAMVTEKRNGHPTQVA
jgi:hypothetical protein